VKHGTAEVSRSVEFLLFVGLNVCIFSEEHPLFFAIGIEVEMLSPGGQLFFASGLLSLDLEALERNRKQKEKNSAVSLPC
jgi:hypothetical protein